MSKNDYYKRVGKDLKKWIGKKYPEKRKIRVSGERGPSSRFSNDDLVEIALEVKKELRGEEITPSNLEQTTGIGRQVWRRRVKEEINRINTPVISGREFGLEDKDDEINHVNIDVIVEKFGHNPRELVNHLYHLEESRIRLYSMVKKLEKENKILIKYKEESEKLSAKNDKLQEKLHYYIHLANNLSVSSYYPSLRHEMGARENTINMQSNPERSSDIANLNGLFPSPQELASSKKQYEDLTKNQARRAGEELFATLIDEFGELMDDNTKVDK